MQQKEEKNAHMPAFEKDQPQKFPISRYVETN